MVTESFRGWFFTQLDERGWSQAEFARRADMSQGNVSRTMSGDYNVREIFCIKAARVFGIPPEIVLREAGILPRRQVAIIHF